MGGKKVVVTQDDYASNDHFLLFINQFVSFQILRAIHNLSRLLAFGLNSKMKIAPVFGEHSLHSG